MYAMTTCQQDENHFDLQKQRMLLKLNDGITSNRVGESEKWAGP